MPSSVKKLIGVMAFISITLTGMRLTTAFFSDIGQSTANTFQAAAQFPTTTPLPTSTPTAAIPITPTVTPTPFRVNPGDVVINEIMWMGTQDDTADEWIELRNMTSTIIDISGWVVDNLGSGTTNDIVIPSGKSIAANGFFLIANNSKADGNHNVDPDYITNINLLNRGEQLRLRTSPGGAIIDTADDDGGGWFAGVNPRGQNPERSMERNDIPGDGTVPTNWHSATSATNMDAGAREIATPRAANSPP